MKITHLINTIGSIPEGSDLAVAQPLTLESMRRARARAVEAGIEVDVVAAAYGDEQESIPDWARATTPLQRSSRDREEFTDRRRLPCLADLLSRLKENSGDSDISVYSNIDIGLQPHFYIEVARIMEERGCDSLSITRRSVPEHLCEISQLEEIYAEEGARHPGDDCFAIRSQRLSSFRIPEVYTGASWFDKTIVVNCAIQAGPFLKLRDRHLTFHVGADVTWINPKTETVSTHNLKELRTLISESEKKVGEFYRRHALWIAVESIYEQIGFEVPRPGFWARWRAIQKRLG